jgi:ASCH domain
MKALTIWQPWASLIMVGAKPFEFRGWQPPRSIIGQRIVIHAAARKIDREETCELYHVLYHRLASDELLKAARETCLYPKRALDVLRQALTTGLPMACGLGTVIIGEPLIGTAVAEMFGVARANDSDRDQHANWGWPLIDVEAWPEPIPMKGMQGLWTWPTPEDAGL